MQMIQTMALDPADEPEPEGPLTSTGKVSTDCVRCGRDIREAEGGVQVRPKEYVCWNCERPGEDLLETAERWRRLEAQIEAFQRFREAMGVIR